MLTCYYQQLSTSMRQSNNIKEPQALLFMVPTKELLMSLLDVFDGDGLGVSGVLCVTMGVEPYLCVTMGILQCNDCN